MTRTALQALSALYGIGDGYHDIAGHYHPTGDETRRALLSAMGVAAANEADALESLGRRRQQQWRRVLPAVKVFTTGQDVQIPVTLPRHQQHGMLRWILDAEDGRTHTGGFRPGDLEVLEETCIDEMSVARFNLVIQPEVGLGYHTFRVEDSSKAFTAEPMRLIVTPERCHVPDQIAAGKRFWGLSIQLYSIRSERNWGIGDFDDLAAIIENAAGLGCSCIGLNPLHALYPHDPDQASPYSPSSRLFLNPLYLAIEGMADFKECDAVREQIQAGAFQQRLAELRGRPMVDYAAVAELKYPILMQLFTHFHQNHLAEPSSRGRAFLCYQKTQGDTLHQHARFEARRAVLQTAGARAAENQTPKEPGEPDDFTVAFYKYLQWQTEKQLRRVHQTAMDRGLIFGLYQDLAVGSDLHGSDTRANPSVYASSAHIGAPPDAFSPTGQDWHLAPYIPHQLEALAYAPFIDLLRRNMRHAGVLRIDHVMAMRRLFWIPEQKDVPGAYVDYPMHDLEGILALESQRNRCLVIGEDLGTVSDDLRASMRARDIFSYKVFSFERDWHGDQGYLPAQSYPAYSLVTAATHDLPTVAGFWRGTDLKLRDQLGLFRDPEDRERQYSERALDRRRLITALKQAGLWTQSDTDPGTLPPGLNEALQTFLARSPAALMMIQIEDMLGLEEQTNLPGTTAEHPNWRRKLPVDIETWSNDARLTDLARRVQSERSREL